VILIAFLLVAVVAAVAVKALHRKGFGGPDATALGVLGAVAGATIACLAYTTSGELVALAESAPYAALCAIAGPHGC